jgi:hypothetical protein
MMEKTEDLSNTERADRIDRDLSEELEYLYRRVARLDQPDASSETGDALLADNKAAQDLRQHAAPYQNPPNREELMGRLMAIEGAYEQLLTYWPFAREYPSQSPSKEHLPGISLPNGPPAGM